MLSKVAFSGSLRIMPEANKFYEDSLKGIADGEKSKITNNFGKIQTKFREKTRSYTGPYKLSAGHGYSQELQKEVDTFILLDPKGKGIAFFDLKEFADLRKLMDFIKKRLNETQF